MRKLFVILGLVLTGCSTVGDVMPTGVDTYTVSSRMGGQFPVLKGPKGPGSNIFQLAATNKS